MGPSSPGSAADEAVSGAVRALLRAARTLRTYPSDNEISQRALDALAAQLGPVLPLRLELRSDQILRGDVPLLDEADRSDLVSAMYADGIRRLDLADGLPRDELERFVGVLATPIHPDDLSEDYVTHLWEADLQHIRVAAIDPYLDVDLPEDVLEGKEKPTGESEDVGRVREVPVPPPPEEAFRITEADRLRVREEMDEAAQDVPWGAFVEAIFETLHSPVGQRRPEDVVRLVEECFQRLVSDLRLEEARRVLEHLAQRPPERARRLLRDAIGRMVDPDRLAPLHDAVEAGRGDRAQIGRLLARMSPFVCETACVFLGRATQEPTRRFYADLLVHVGRPALQPVLEHLAGAPPEARWTFVRILGRMRAPEATAALLEALPEADAPLRREIARSLAQIRSPKALAALLDLGLDDADRRTRVIALRGLGGARSGLDPRRLLERIRSVRFAGLGDEEKDLLFDALGGVGGGGAVPFLREILSPRWWDWRSRPAEWRRAAKALAAIGTADAREVLRRGADARRRALAEACAEALGAPGEEGGA